MFCSPSHRLVQEEDHGSVYKELVVTDGVKERQALVDAVRCLRGESECDSVLKKEEGKRNENFFRARS
jgi:hypothetical protein